MCPLPLRPPCPLPLILTDWFCPTQPPLGPRGGDYYDMKKAPTGHSYIHGDSEAVSQMAHKAEGMNLARFCFTIRSQPVFSAEKTALANGIKVDVKCARLSMRCCGKRVYHPVGDPLVWVHLDLFDVYSSVSIYKT
jgi:hypothetical protein